MADRALFQQNAREVLLPSDDSDSTLSSILDDYYCETEASSEIGTVTPPSELAEDEATPVWDSDSEDDLSSILEEYYCDVTAASDPVASSIGSNASECESSIMSNVEATVSDALVIILTLPSTPSIAHLARPPVIQAEDHLQVPGSQLPRRRQTRRQGHPSTSRGAQTQTRMQHSPPLFMAPSYNATEVTAESTTVWSSAYRIFCGFCGFSTASQEPQRKGSFYMNFSQQFEDEGLAFPANRITEVTASGASSIWGLLGLCAQAPLRFFRCI